MFRAIRELLTRARGAQLELPLAPAATLTERLTSLGLASVRRVVLTSNASVMVSVRGDVLRLHEAYATAPDEVLRAVVAFIMGRGRTRTLARRALLSYPVAGAEARPRRRRREAQHPDDDGLALRLAAEHDRINRESFGGTLGRIALRVSRRLRARLGHYAPTATHGSAEIAISRRHIRRDGWADALATLAHEMIHQWQEERGLAVDHGPHFRRKARELGIVPRARRPVGASRPRR